MQDYIYSVIAFLAMVIHLVINYNMLPGRKVFATAYAQRYRWFLASLFAYYVVDACWGVFAGLGWTSVLYVDTVLYFLAMAVSVLLWCRYVIAYLDLGKRAALALNWFGQALLGLYVVLLTVNVFNGCVFHFDEQGRYVAGFIRFLIFHILTVLNVIMAVFALVRSFGSRDSARRRYVVTFMFCLTMALAIVFQIAWPLWPFYALGCLVGNCFFHIFVVEDELAELRRAVIEREQAAKYAAELEEALERARAAEKARSMFFSIVSHDIRTPLNAIIGYSELLQFGIEDKAERDEALSSICASGKTLLQLVNDVLDLAKMDSGKLVLKPEPLRLSQLVEEVLSSFKLTAAGKGVALVNNTAGVPTVLLDGHRFRQILFNLIGNAIKFTDRGAVTVSASYAVGRIVMSVSDTGCGIAPDQLSRIFDPFVQAQDPSHSADRAGGTGLGLSICRRLVEAMGGELDVKSELGKGSKFSIIVPASTAEKEECGVKSGGDNSPTHNSQLTHLPGHVLVVDDAPLNREVIVSLLVHAGVASVDQACDGVEALSKLDDAVKAGNPYDFVYTDLWMPNMNGIEFAEKLRGDPRFSGIPVYAVTADAEFLRDDRNHLFTGILLKPITYGKLRETFS